MRLADTLEIGSGRDVVIDVDYDFFFDCEETVADAPWKQLSMAPSPSEIIEAYHSLNFRSIVAHDEALETCIHEGIKDAVCIHFDYHHDWYIAPDLLDALSLSSLEGSITCANYAAIGAKAGVFRKFIWVYPDHHEHPDAIQVPESLKNCGVEVFSIPYSKYKSLLHDDVEIKNIKLALACLSPEFVPEAHIREFSSLFNCDKEFEYRALDYAFERVISGRRDCQKKYFRLNLASRVISLFHGSPLSGLKTLYTGMDEVHVSPSSAFATCYILKPNSDSGWIQGIDHVSQERESVFLIAPDGEEIPGQVKGALYVSDGNKTLVTAQGDCKNYDFVVKAPVPVVAESTINDVRWTLVRNGVAIPNRQYRIDISPLPIDSSGQAEFCDWMSMPWEALTLLRSTPFYLMVFTQLHSKEPWRQFFPLVYWKRFASRCLYPLVPTSICSAEDDSYHGLSHGLDTALIAVIIAYALDIPPTPILLAALCHDFKPRASESAEMFSAVLGDVWREYSGINDKRMIYAVSSHSELSPVKDDVANVLRDADRVRLSWERGYEPKFFSTEIGAEIAQNGANYLGELQARLMFSHNVFLEIHSLNSHFELIIWHLGRRYTVGNTASLSLERVNYLAALFNVSSVVLFPEEPDRDRVSLTLPRELPLVRVGILQTPTDIYRVQDDDHIIWTIKAKMFMAGKPPKLVSGTNGDHQSIIRSLHVEVGYENIGWICDNLLELASINAALVYSRDPSADEGDEFRFITKCILRRKYRNLNLSSVRLIAPVSWCWLDRPEDTAFVLTPAQDSYSPLTATIGPRLVGGNVFEDTLEDVRRRRERCGSCCLSINCVSFDFASWQGSASKVPRNSAKFRSWAPYSAD